MQFIKVLLLAVVLSLTSLTALQVSAQSAPEIAKLAKDFNVSPKVLSKFSKAGLSSSDLKSGLELAKQVVNSGDLKIDEAVNQIFSLKQDGKDWEAIAKEFDVTLKQ